MTGEKKFSKLIKGLTPKLNAGEYVFATVKDIEKNYANVNSAGCSGGNRCLDYCRV